MKANASTILYLQPNCLKIKSFVEYKRQASDEPAPVCSHLLDKRLCFSLRINARQSKWEVGIQKPMSQGKGGLEKSRDRGKEAG